VRATGWGAVALVAAGAIVAQAFGRFTYGVLLPAIRNDLDHSNTVAGLLGTVNVTAYLIGTIVVASLSTRFRLQPIFRSGFAFSLSGLALAVVSPNAAVLGVALFVMGIGAGIGLGILFAGQLSRVLRDRSGDEAWRDVYLVELVLGAVVVVLVLLLLRHRQDEVAGQSVGGGLLGFGVLRTMPGWLPLTASYAAYGFTYLLAISFLTSRLEDDAGYSEGLAATMFGVVGVGTVLGGVTLGHLADRFGERATMTAGFTAFSASIVAIMTGVVALVAIGAIGLGLMFGGLAAVTASYVVRHTTPDRFGPSYAAATFAFGVSQMLSPQVGGLLADATGSFTIVFALSAGFALCGAFASSRLPS
jgi:MFS family permease